MFDLLQSHTTSEVEALREDLKANGLKVPVIVDETGEIIDGRLRARLCEELEIEWRPTARVESGLSADQKAALRIKLNLLRRSTPPTASQRREYVRTLIKAEPGLSNGSIAKMCGMDPSNVSRIRSEMVTKGEAKAAAVTTGLDGKTRQKPVRSERPKPVSPAPSSSSPRREVAPAEAAAKPESTAKHQAAGQLSDKPVVLGHAAADAPLVLRQAEAADGFPADAKEGCLDCSSFKLKLVQAVSARNGCWEWLAQDEQGNRYHVSCRRVEVVEARKVG